MATMLDLNSVRNRINELFGALLIERLAKLELEKKLNGKRKCES
jgi:hypothetical protein